MLCPHCESETKVFNKRGTMRRRECKNEACGHKFSTEEFVSHKTMPRSNAVAQRLKQEGRAPRPRLWSAKRQQPKAESKPVPLVPAQVKSPQPTPPVRPAAFFSRESMVPDAAPRDEVRGWAAPALPPAADGRMR